MDINAAFPSKYVRACDLQGQDRTLAISSVVMDDVGDHEPKPVVYFNGTDKGLVLNKTNANVIAGLYGPNTDGWIGQRITLFPTQTDFQGKQVECIRVRMQKPQVAQQQQAAAPPPPPPDNPPSGVPHDDGGDIPF